MPFMPQMLSTANTTRFWSSKLNTNAIMQTQAVFAQVQEQQRVPVYMWHKEAFT